MKKLSAAMFMCIIFFACSKKNDTITRLAYLTVSCTLNTNFGNQIYSTTHFSRGDTSTNSSYPPIILDGSKVVTNYAAEGQRWGTFSHIIFFDSPLVLGVGTRQIFAFSIPTINSIAN